MTNRIQKAAKEDVQLFFRAFGLLGKVGKIKLDMSKLRRDKDALLKQVGVAVQQNYATTRKLESGALMALVGTQLADIQQIEQEIKNSQDEIGRLQADFRQNQMNKGQPDPQQQQQQEQQR